MRKIPKLDDFQAPEGYFEQLPDEIISRLTEKSKPNWIQYAAAVAILVVGFGVWQFTSINSSSDQSTLNDEVNLYIESQYWTAEDVLSMSDNPEAILDEIIDEELILMEDSWLEDNQNLF